MPQAIPDFDSDGIGRGNAEKVGLYTTSVDGTGALTTSNNAVGNENFKGFSFELLYSITDNLTILQSFRISNNQTKNVYQPRIINYNIHFYKKINALE